ncbi:MAG: divergent polysaccharide deacetylase family protein [Alphaproteobacteria bacterium]|nr:MAG: divergent polysaccharide deacetylase family protein [Alphaproteobacteria bacterium]
MSGGPRRGGNGLPRDTIALVIAWVVFFGIVVTLVSWLAINADKTRAEWPVRVPMVILALMGAEPAEPAPAPEPPSASVAPVAAPAAPVAAPEPPPPLPAMQRVALAPAPIPSMIEVGPHGPLPRVGPLGERPFQIYAHPFEAMDDQPLIAVLVTGLGLERAELSAALDRLPPEVSLAFSPYAPNLPELVGGAREHGHEVLLAVPMEPLEFPRVDPGPYTLLSSLSPAENLDRLSWVLSRAPGAIGVVAEEGGRFATSMRALLPMMEVLSRRGLMVVDPRTAAGSVTGRVARDLGVPRALGTVAIAHDANPRSIDQRLFDAEAVARGGGAALVVVSVNEIAIDRVVRWTGLLPRRGIRLAPVSAIANRQPEP